MSILMDALKQQSSSQPLVQNSASFWRKVALLLALLVALLSGALLAYWLQPQALSPATVSAEAVVMPAQPADILAVLQAATPQAAAQPAVETVQERLAAEKPVSMVTVAEADGTAERIALKRPAEAVAKVEPAAEMAVSDELRDKFSQALKATEQTSQQRVIRSNDAPAPDISTLDAALLQQIPALRFDAHVYATSATQRWVKVNGKTLQESQWVTADIRIREITQQYVLLQLGSELFSMAALTQWPQG
ncbi:general secretion pathway protein GspB [Rheinheimera sp.]|uniref:general secretion pathway protein GspB n=1 Tax=Rheinheimera sp. TaxID=1869214 RepID=UPI004047DBA5